MSIAQSHTATILFISHGGGPLPLLGDAAHAEMVSNLKQIANQIVRPTAILVISAHWEETVASITSSPHPSMIYDYYGFPAESYQIQYPAPGEPSLAHAIFTQLEHHGINAKLDDQRGFDHGLYVPLKIMYPEANIPCIQLSLTNSLDPEEHIKIGKALSDIAYEGLLILGSGFSFHNMKAFFSKETTETKAMNASFEQWLIDTCSNTEINETERTARLINWAEAPGAEFCHPREEHLLPLHVCYGAAQRPCSEYFELHILNKKASVYLWQ